MENKQMEETPADPGADSLGSAGLSNLPSERVLPAALEATRQQRTASLKVTTMGGGECLTTTKPSTKWFCCELTNCCLIAHLPEARRLPLAKWSVSLRGATVLLRESLWLLLPTGPTTSEWSGSLPPPALPLRHFTGCPRSSHLSTVDQMLCLDKWQPLILHNTSPHQLLGARRKQATALPNPFFSQFQSATAPASPRGTGKLCAAQAWAPPSRGKASGQTCQSSHSSATPLGIFLGPLLCVTSTTWVHGLTRNRTLDFLLYETMLQPTGAPARAPPLHF